MKLTRKKFIGALVGAGVLAGGGVWTLQQTAKGTRIENVSRTIPEGNVLSFRSRPDLKPPAVEIEKRPRGIFARKGDCVFLAPQPKTPGSSGAMILDSEGHLVWFHQPEERRLDNFRVQHYRDEPVLTWWEGRVTNGHGSGEYVLLDRSYREIKRVRAGNGYKGDLHEFLLTPQGTALFTAYHPVRHDLTPAGGSKDALVYDGIAQEVDVESGKVLFEWHSLDHVPVELSYGRPPKNPDDPFDYFHINSIDVDHDGNLLISSRNTWAVYKVDRASGRVLWRLGGKESDFEMGPGTRTAYQHDARRHPDGTITIFDNGGNPPVHRQSRGVVLRLDMQKMRATLVREYVHPGRRILAGAEGNVQMLPTGEAFIGWGYEPFFSGFTGSGDLVFDARLPGQGRSYRTYWHPWEGHPEGRPAVVAKKHADGGITIYASWNGSTAVKRWRVLSGRVPSDLREAGDAPKRGFETAVTLRGGGPYFAIQAVDESGNVLATSGTTRAR
ncbi:arylsulfotransferase family protein [Rubrobacter calidifluminis]|uniref:arylsulfotransferase family protein n=1 Tax=Rubrobacter calidifluminis TaxID=1392640 RepID=UPI0023605AC5|nr:arylsulfotransferase family protein [Rubrobacter calidifluminis]